jgi:hypothetical protein
VVPGLLTLPMLLELSPKRYFSVDSMISNMTSEFQGHIFVLNDPQPFSIFFGEEEWGIQQ